MSRKYIVPVVNLIPGVQVSDDVYNDMSSVVILGGTTLTDKHIDKLLMHSIREVIVTKNDAVDINKIASGVYAEKKDMSAVIVNLIEHKKTNEEYKHVDKLYKQAKTEVVTDLDAFAKGKGLNVEKLLNSSESIIKGLHTKSDFFNYATLAEVVDDEITYKHCMNTSILCNIIGTWLNLDTKLIESLTLAGLLHDIGKTQIDKNIINKKGKLTYEEFEEVKKHPVYSYNMIKDLPIDTEVKLAVLRHHEKMDGSGYPLGLDSKSLSQICRILSIADIFDAMTSKRPHRESYNPFYTLDFIHKNMICQLDASLLYSILLKIAESYVGSKVLLQSNEIGEVLFINKHDITRPIVQVGSEAIDLSKDRLIGIDKVI